MTYARTILKIIISLLVIILCACSADKATNPTDSDSTIVKIGEQIWMANNLNVTHYRNGEPIPHITDKQEWVNLKTGAWCYYDNDSAKGKIFGKLYNWYAVNDPRGLAPEGWRIPTDEDMKQLEIYLGMTPSQADTTSLRGSPVGSKLAGGYELWLNNNLRNHPDFNKSGFSAIPGGYRYYNGDFYYLRIASLWWTASEYNQAHAVGRSLYYDFTAVNRYYDYKENGFSIRCIKE